METEISYEVAFDDDFQLAPGKSPTVVVFQTDNLEQALKEREERSERSRDYRASHGLDVAGDKPFYIIAVIKHVSRQRIA